MGSLIWKLRWRLSRWEVWVEHGPQPAPGKHDGDESAYPGRYLGMFLTRRGAQRAADCETVTPGAPHPQFVIVARMPERGGYQKQILDTRLLAP